MHARGPICPPKWIWGNFSLSVRMTSITVVILLVPGNPEMQQQPPWPSCSFPSMQVKISANSSSLQGGELVTADTWSRCQATARTDLINVTTTTTSVCVQFSWPALICSSKTTVFRCKEFGGAFSRYFSVLNGVFTIYK